MAIPEKIKQVKSVNVPGIALCIARVAQSERVFVGSSDAKVYSLDFSTEKPEPTPLEGHASYVTGVAVAAGHVVSGGYDRQLIWRNLESGETVRSVRAHEKWIRAVVAAPDGRTIATVADDMVCKIHDAQTGATVHELRGHAEKTPNHFPSMLYAAAFSSDGKLLATGDKPGHVVVWETATGKQAAAFESPENYTWDPKQRRHSIGGIRSLAFSRDGNQLAVGGIARIGNIDHLDGKALVQLYDWQTGERQYALEHSRHKGLVNQLAYDASGERLLAAGGAGGGFFFFIDVKNQKPLTDEDAKAHIHGIVPNEAWDKLYTAGHGAAAVWEMTG